MIPAIIQGVALVASTAANLIGNAVAAGDEAKARKLREDFAAQYGDEMLPQLDRAVAQELPPELAARYDKATNATLGQQEALRALRKGVAEGGETAEDRAAYYRAAQETSRAASGAQAAVGRSLANRGLQGSGLDAALQQQAGQQAVDRNAMMQTEQAAEARRRYIAQLQALGLASGNIRGQDMERMARQDSLQQFNANQRTRAQDYNLGLNQQRFDNRLAMLDAKGRALNGVVAGYQQAANTSRRTGKAIGDGILGLGDLASGAAGGGSDEKKKKGDW